MDSVLLAVGCGTDPIRIRAARRKRERESAPAVRARALSEPRWRECFGGASTS